jgi:hypothetical protein
MKPRMNPDKHGFLIRELGEFSRLEIEEFALVREIRGLCFFIHVHPCPSVVE